MTPRDDERLAIRCQLGEPDAIDALVRRWHPDLSRYVRAWLPADDEASDVLQNVWIAVLRGLPGLRHPASIAPWLFRIARATIMTRLRGRYAEPTGLDELDPSHLAVDVPPSHIDLERGLERLGPVEREAVLLFHLQELSLAETAEILAVPIGTVKSRLHRGRTQLKAFMQGATR